MVTRCYLCDENPQMKRRLGGVGLSTGKVCPLCNQQTCQYHLATVRWKWKADSATAETQVCKNCKRTYRYRTWDVYQRDWIS